MPAPSRVERRVLGLGVLYEICPEGSVPAPSRVERRVLGLGGLRLQRAMFRISFQMFHGLRFGLGSET